MTKEILARLFYSFIFSLTISLVISWTNYQTTEGFEAKQADFILVILTFLLCIINLISSLTALFNLKIKIRENLILSALSFFGLPMIILIILLVLFLVNRNPTETFLSLIMFSIPSISYLLSLFYNFIKFRENNQLN